MCYTVNTFHTHNIIFISLLVLDWVRTATPPNFMIPIVKCFSDKICQRLSVYYFDILKQSDIFHLTKIILKWFKNKWMNILISYNNSTLRTASVHY